MELELRQVCVRRDETLVVKGVSLTLAQGELVVLRGVNGSGKSTLLNAVMGHPKYTVEGSVLIDGVDVTHFPPHERARLGLFLALQQPPELAGVSLAAFMSTALGAQGERPAALNLARELGAMRLDPRFAQRSVNEGFSGGEKKRSEIVQLLALHPRYALLDESDSGLDPAAMQYVADAISTMRPTTGFLVVTHSTLFVDLLKPTRILTMADGILVP